MILVLYNFLFVFYLPYIRIYTYTHNYAIYKFSQVLGDKYAALLTRDLTKQSPYLYRPVPIYYAVPFSEHVSFLLSEGVKASKPWKSSFIGATEYTYQFKSPIGLLLTITMEWLSYINYSLSFEVHLVDQSSLRGLANVTGSKICSRRFLWGMWWIFFRCHVEHWNTRGQWSSGDIKNLMPEDCLVSIDSSIWARFCMFMLFWEDLWETLRMGSYTLSCVLWEQSSHTIIGVLLWIWITNQWRRLSSLYWFGYMGSFLHVYAILRGSLGNSQNGYLYTEPRSLGTKLSYYYWYASLNLDHESITKTVESPLQSGIGARFCIFMLFWEDLWEILRMGSYYCTRLSIHTELRSLGTKLSHYSGLLQLNLDSKNIDIKNIPWHENAWYICIKKCIFKMFGKPILKTEKKILGYNNYQWYESTNPTAIKL